MVTEKTEVAEAEMSAIRVLGSCSWHGFMVNRMNLLQLCFEMS